MVVASLLRAFGVEDADDPEVLERQVAKLSQGTITKEARIAWEKAGMPSPAVPWMAQYMREKGNG